MNHYHIVFYPERLDTTCLTKKIIENINDKNEGFAGGAVLFVPAKLTR